MPVKIFACDRGIPPQDAELIKKPRRHESDEWRIIADASLVSGGLYCETDYSYVDFTLEKTISVNPARYR